ncbi:hypothetical protein BDD12DRAFT_905634 [Trichophaea hybrida]|nr:hypothetical protein BDD12DRAFT_905634 [Trichophaea hybrida]
MTDATYHVTSKDLRKMESRESKKHDGKIPADSDPSLLKVIFPPPIPPAYANEKVNKVNCIPTQRRPIKSPRKLATPRRPPGSLDMKSADARFHVRTGSGRFSGGVGGEDDAMRESVAAGSKVRGDGEELHKRTTV